MYSDHRKASIFAFAAEAGLSLCPHAPSPLYHRQMQLEGFKVKSLLFLWLPPIWGEALYSLNIQGSLSHQVEMAVEGCLCGVWQSCGALGECPASHSCGISCHLVRLFPITLTNG